MLDTKLAVFLSVGGFLAILFGAFCTGVRDLFVSRKTVDYSIERQQQLNAKQIKEFLGDESYDSDDNLSLLMDPQN